MLDGKRHGYGRTVNHQNDIIEGQFENDELIGFSRIISNDGTIITGLYKYGMKDGPY